MVKSKAQTRFYQYSYTTNRAKEYDKLSFYSCMVHHCLYKLFNISMSHMRSDYAQGWKFAKQSLSNTVYSALEMYWHALQTGQIYVQQHPQGGKLSLE